MNTNLKASHDTHLARAAAKTKEREQPRRKTDDKVEEEEEAAARPPVKRLRRLHAADAHSKDKSARDRLPLGTFSTGTSLYRNRLHSGESFQEGHVTLSNLVLPDCSSAVCTTFCADETELASWLGQDVFRGVRDVLVVMHGEDRVVGDAALTPICPTSTLGGWFSIRVKPHTRGCLHAKLLLFRSNQGLRVVACGSNLYQAQWESDRDALWIQDFYPSGRHCYSEEDEGFETDDDGSTSDSATNFTPSFGRDLRSFLDDLSQCREMKDTRKVQARLDGVFGGIDLSAASARFVFSFPRPSASCKPRGGWQQLAKTVQGLFNNGAKRSAGRRADQKDDWVVYAMSGSFGNLEPDFLGQMHQAILGISDHESNSNRKMKKAPAAWEDVRGMRCLWPSNETAVEMHLPAFIDSARPIPYSYWKTIPKTAQRQVFFDAPPNPPQQGLPQLGCHPFSHAKVMYATTSGGDGDDTGNHNNDNSEGVLYVGSHNFSKAAWGIRNVMPKNVEAGVVLRSSIRETCNEWRRRLPCILPPSCRPSPGNYIPASVPLYIREVYVTGQTEMALELLRDLWRNGENRGSPKVAPVPEVKTSTGVEEETIDLCDSDSD